MNNNFNINDVYNLIKISPTEKNIIKLAKFINRNFSYADPPFKHHYYPFEALNIYKMLNVSGYGNCKHYAILFKFIMDVMNIKCETGIRAKFEKKCAGLLAVFDDFRRMFAMKLLLNGISTAGHVLSGNVLQNRMINVRVSNDKLFYRAIGMVQEFGSVDAEVARRCLLQSIYGEDGFQKMESVPVSKHITAARDLDKIVPVAIILAAQVAGGSSSKNTTAQIRKMLETEPSLRQVIKKFST